jgi:hypothetical protein
MFRAVPVSLSFALALIACDMRENASAVSQAATSCPPVSWTLVGGDPNVLLPGDVVTNPRDLVLENGIVRLTYEAMWNDPSTPVQDEAGAHMLYRWLDGEYRRALSSRYGDWTFFANPFQESAETATIISASEDVVEVAFEWPHHRLDLPGPYNGCYHSACGVIERDHEGSAIYRSDGSGEFVVIDEVRFVKTVRIERCSEGYFVGYHSDPRLSPKNGLTGNHENSMGEREIGTGGGNAVTFSSAGVVVRNPEAGQHAYVGIDDPPYASEPRLQPDGPWWVADLPGFAPPDDVPFARFIAMEHRLEVGVWQFAPTHLGSTVVHYVNDQVEADGRVGRYQVFIGAFPYVSQDLAQEPTPAVYDGVIERLPVTWPI